MAHTAYLDDAEITDLMVTFGAMTTRVYDEAGAQAFLAVWPDRAVLSFRGTQLHEGTPGRLTDREESVLERIKTFLGLERDSPLLAFFSNDDVLADLQFNKMPFDGHEHVEVHLGFLREIDKLWQTQIVPDLERHTVGIPVWVTGHSLGGAMATLAGMRYPFEEVVTFGEPRVGRHVDLVFKAKSHTRYVNGADPVTKVPPEFPFGYGHHGHVVTIRDLDGKTDPLYDHAIVYYSENLAV